MRSMHHAMQIISVWIIQELAISPLFQYRFGKPKVCGQHIWCPCVLLEERVPAHTHARSSRWRELKLKLWLFSLFDLGVGLGMVFSFSVEFVQLLPTFKFCRNLCNWWIVPNGSIRSISYQIIVVEISCSLFCIFPLISTDKNLSFTFLHVDFISSFMR